MKLTEPQLRELRKLARGRQYTYGRHRARVQWNLRLLGLVRFLDDDGKPESVTFASLCEITDAGRAVIQEIDMKRQTSERTDDD